MRNASVFVLAALVFTGCAVSGATEGGDPPGEGRSAATKAPVVPGCSDDPGCLVRTQGGIGSTSCKPFATWRTYAEADCKSLGLTLTEIAVGSACGDGNSFEYTRYSCCGTQKCPAKASDWPPGSPCVEPLEGCRYKNECGGVDEWHCKLGTWQMNSCTNCCPL